jgi:proteasome accessory factor C
MNTQRDTAQAQLERILYILPVAARSDGVAIDDLARALHVAPQTILRDLEQATARAYYHPGGTVDPFTITVDRSTVHVHAPQEFIRPARLSEREALALALGLRTLAGEADAARRGEILDLATRLEAQLGAPGHTSSEAAPAWRADQPARVAESDVEYDALALAFDDDGFRGVVADAIELGRMCTIWYLKPGDIAPMHRRIAPYRLMHANGMWYVAAYDEEREALRFFRMDRVLDASLLDAQAPPAPAELDTVIQRGAPYSGSDEVDVVVRYSARVARWVIERAPHAQLDEDGSTVLTHRVADPRWIVRHVLQYGGEAVVEAPAVARSWVEQAVNKVVEL